MFFGDLLQQICLRVFSAFYLTVSQVSLQMGDLPPQLLQLLLAGLHLVALFSLLPLPLLLQPLDDPLLDAETEEGDGG